MNKLLDIGLGNRFTDRFQGCDALGTRSQKEWNAMLPIQSKLLGASLAVDLNKMLSGRLLNLNHTTFVGARISPRMSAA